MPEIGSRFMLGEQHRTSSKSMRFPLRPGNGSIGDKCVVKANHLFVELSDNDIHQYDVTITPEVSPTSRVNRAVMEQLVKLYRESDFGQRLPAYDGGKILYTAGPFPFLTKEFKVTILDDDGYGPRGKEREFKVVIKLVTNVDLHQLRMFLQERQAAAPQEALQCLNVVLRQLPSTMYCPVGRSFFSPDIGKINLLDRWVIWKGFHRKILPTQMGLSLNIDMSSTLFIRPLPVVKFVTDFLLMDDSSQPLSRAGHWQIEDALRGVKVEVTHHGKMCRKYRVSGLTLQSTKELTFLVDDRGTTKSVVEYFQEKYGVVIQHTHWPCLQVGNQQKLIYLPMEVCNIVEGQRYSTEMLNVHEIAAFQNAKCQGPHEREHDILKVVHYNAHSEDPFLREFGLNMSEKLVSIDARVLSPPLLQYHKTGEEKDCLPRVGEWSMRNRKMVNGGAVHSWICINFAASVNSFSAERFCYYLGKMCHTCGMVYNPNPVFPVVKASPHLVESDFRDVMVNLEGKELDLVIVILPDRNDSLYGDVKRICETRYGIVSQCCLGKHVNTLRRQCLENMALKINVKVGGTNTVLVDAVSRRLPIVSERPTIVFGADVTHPPPGENSSSPSIAAVVASEDWPAITKYASLVSAQSPGHELIQDLFNSSQDLVKGSVTGGMVRELLLSFYRATGHKPRRIIFYRDGISERQFFQILNHEFDAIRKACTSLDPNYQPPVTFVVVLKHHHTRLFANNHGDEKTVERSGNILPGTVVDSKICHPTEFDFYLCSHAGIQGTSRPTHYHVIWDENKFTPDEIQSLTNSLSTHT